jgi:hypothetical protein
MLDPFQIRFIPLAGMAPDLATKADVLSVPLLTAKRDVIGSPFLLLTV